MLSKSLSFVEAPFLQNICLFGLQKTELGRGKWAGGQTKSEREKMKSSAKLVSWRNNSKAWIDYTDTSVKWDKVFSSYVIFKLLPVIE